MTDQNDKSIAAFRAAASSDAEYCLELNLPVGAIIDGMRHLGSGRFEIPLARGTKLTAVFEGTVDDPVSGASSVDVEFVRRQKRAGHRAVWLTRILENGRDTGGAGSASPELTAALCEASGVAFQKPGPWNEPGPKESGWYDLEGDNGKVVPLAYWDAEKSVWWPILSRNDFYDRADSARWRTSGHATISAGDQP